VALLAAWVCLSQAFTVGQVMARLPSLFGCDSSGTHAWNFSGSRSFSRSNFNDNQCHQVTTGFPTSGKSKGKMGMVVLIDVGFRNSLVPPVVNAGNLRTASMAARRWQLNPRTASRFLPAQRTNTLASKHNLGTMGDAMARPVAAGALQRR
jgi:hypothetical protein